jgi:hypothetical protein
MVVIFLFLPITLEAQVGGSDTVLIVDTVSTGYFVLESESIPGDVNGDGLVDVDDVIFLIEFIYSGGLDPVQDNQLAKIYYVTYLVDCVSGVILSKIDVSKFVSSYDSTQVPDEGHSESVFITGDSTTMNIESIDTGSIDVDSVDDSVKD